MRRSNTLLAIAMLIFSAAAATAQSGAGGYHALVIGNNNYASLPKLKTAEADAREVASLLKEFYGFETRLLLNATRQQIVSAIFSYRQTLGLDANLLVYYAGHGINDAQADKSYWLPVDATRDDDSNWISADDITTRIRAIPARHVLVISDSCYSGTLTRGLGEALPPPNAREQFIQRMMAGRSRTLMASGGDEPVADGGGGGHSVFASALLRGLREMDKGKFTAAELFRHYVQEPVAGRAQQTPEYNPLRNSGHESGDFVFVKIKTDGKSVEVTVKAPSPAPAVPVDPAAIELSFWESIKSSTDADDFKAYLDSYPSGRFAALARNNIRRLEAAKSVPAPTEKNPTDKLAAGNAPTANAPASNATANTKVAWQKFEPEGEGFYVQLPTTPTSETKVNPDNQRMQMRTHLSETQTHSFYVASLDYRGLFQRGAVSFDSFAKGFLDSYCEPARKQGLTCEVTFQRELTLSGHPGKQYAITMSGNGRRIDGVLRMYMTASHVYAFHALGGKEGDATVDKFLNSFAIAAAKPAGR
ncbi:MAG TPA: caspase family protein [Pyrinomonadaceae bacterium]|nr:caspase family protein [Pyrinomonadaceae bacterium]